MNRVILCGNLCNDIEVRYTKTNKSVIHNRIAVRNEYKNSDGKYDSEFINLVFWNSQCDYLSKYAEKGSKILIEGEIKNSKYEKEDGTKSYITEIIVTKLEIIGYKKDANTENESTEKNSENDSTVKSEEDPYESFSKEISISDEDLPF